MAESNLISFLIIITLVMSFIELVIILYLLAEIRTLSQMLKGIITGMSKAVNGKTASRHEKTPNDNSESSSENVSGPNSGSMPQSDRDYLLKNLEDRFQRGEIDQEKYYQAKDLLENG